MKWDIKRKFDSVPDTNTLLESLLTDRGFSGQVLSDFLNPPTINEYIKKMSPDFKKQLSKAQKMILEAIESKDPIFIHGDYDADGVCATAVLYKTIKEILGYEKVYYFLPNRFDHGYGISQSSIRELARMWQDKEADSKSALLVSVDCGITVEDTVLDLAREYGFRVLITDHHQKKASLPKADALLWTDETVGAGISLILSMALGLKDQQIACLAGIAVVTDLAELKGFNRSLVKYSLEIINNNPPSGIKKLLEVSGKLGGEIGTYEIGYVIGPRLNAAGRLQSAFLAIELLIETDDGRQGEIAQKLNEINNERQKKTIELTEYAASGITQSEVFPNVLITMSEEYHEGIIGLIAGKLVQKYYRPAVVVSLGEGMGKGSVRSIPGVNIVELLREVDDLFESIGGHPMAAGFNIDPNKLEDFEKRFTDLMQTKVSQELLQKVLRVDAEVPLEAVSIGLCETLSQLKPYGIGNPEPVFCSKNLGVLQASRIGREANHLMIRFLGGSKEVKALYFDYPANEPLPLVGQKCDCAFTVRENTFNGNSSAELVIKDLVLK